MLQTNLSKICLIVSLLMMVFGVSNGLSSEEYPNRPITMVNAFSAGGTLDIVTRLLCKLAERELRQPFIHENKPGAAGVIGTNYVCKSKPDGYTIGVGSHNVFVTVPHLRETPYNPLTDITEIMAFMRYPYGLSVRADAPWNSIEEVIAYARKNPGKFKFSSTGVGTTQHIFMERLMKKEGVKMAHVPFKTTGEPVTALLGGHVDGTIQGANDVIPHIQAGKLKLLLSFTDKRWSGVPSAPSVLEKGYDFKISVVNSIYSPKGIPEFIRQKLENVFKKAMEDPSFIDLTKNQFSLEPHFWTGKEYAELWRAEYNEMGGVIRGLGISEK